MTNLVKYAFHGRQNLLYISPVERYWVKILFRENLKVLILLDEKHRVVVEVSTLCIYTCIAGTQGTAVNTH